MARTSAPMARPVSALRPEIHRQHGRVLPLIVATIFVIDEERGKLDAGTEQCVYDQIRRRQRGGQQISAMVTLPRCEPLFGSPPAIPQQAGEPGGNHQRLEADAPGKAGQRSHPHRCLPGPTKIHH